MVFSFKSDDGEAANEKQQVLTRNQFCYALRAAVRYTSPEFVKRTNESRCSFWLLQVWANSNQSWYKLRSARSSAASSFCIA